MNFQLGRVCKNRHIRWIKRENAVGGVISVKYYYLNQSRPRVKLTLFDDLLTIFFLGGAVNSPTLDHHTNNDN